MNTLHEYYENSRFKICKFDLRAIPNYEPLSDLHRPTVVPCLNLIFVQTEPGLS